MSADNINWDRVSLSNFSSKLLDSREWFSTANELVSAAEILAPHMIDWWDSLHEWSKDSRKIFNEYGYHSLFMMLYAYAIENLCKGYMVGRLSWKPHLSRVGQRPTLPDYQAVELEFGFAIWRTGDANKNN